MKNVILLFILFCLFFSCKSNNEINLKIKEAEELIRAEQPDSAFALLESITNPEVLSDKVFAHFCMVSAVYPNSWVKTCRSCRKWSEQMIITKSMVLRKIR